VAVSDPQAEIAANLAKWTTLGLVNINSEDIRTARIVGMTLMPQAAGLALMLAASLWQSRPQKLARLEAPN